ETVEWRPIEQSARNDIKENQERAQDEYGPPDIGHIARHSYHRPSRSRRGAPSRPKCATTPSLYALAYGRLQMAIWQAAIICVWNCMHTYADAARRMWTIVTKGERNERPETDRENRAVSDRQPQPA